MGSDFDSWTGVEGAYYMGANSGWELTWVLVALGMCIAALIVGARHELDAYKKQENGN